MEYRYYKLLVPYPQALNHPGAKVSENDDHLLEAFQKLTITIPLVDAIKYTPYAKFLKDICPPHISPKGSNWAKILVQLWWILFQSKREIPKHPWSWVKLEEWPLLDPC